MLHPRGVLTVAGACFVALTAAVVALGAFPPTPRARRDAGAGVAGVVAAMRIVNRRGRLAGAAARPLLLFVVFRRARQRWWLWVRADGDRAPAGMGSQAPGRPARPEDSRSASPAVTPRQRRRSWAPSCSWPARCRGASAPVRVLAVVMILLVGMARVILRAHWPSDVLAGIALGLALAAAAGLMQPRSC